MTVLLIDVGNTALKWTTLEEPDNPQTIVHRGKSHFKRELYEVWERIRPTAVVGCTVAAPEIAFSLTKFFNEKGILWQWVRAQDAFSCERFNLINHYAKPQQLGADRWYAAIGAIETQQTNQPLLVVHTGTATTVDSIMCIDKKRYVFNGGRIAPGPSMMQEMLCKKINSLTNQLGQYQSFPKCTTDAMTTGIIDAQVGLILRARDSMLCHGEEPQVILAGGASAFIAPYLKAEVNNLTQRHNLVLNGLAAKAKRLHFNQGKRH